MNNKVSIKTLEEYSLNLFNAFKAYMPVYNYKTISMKKRATKILISLYTARVNIDNAISLLKQNNINKKESNFVVK